MELTVANIRQHHTLTPLERFNRSQESETFPTAHEQILYLLKVLDGVIIEKVADKPDDLLTQQHSDEPTPELEAMSNEGGISKDQ